MTMEILDHIHQKETVNFQILVEEFMAFWRKQMVNPKAHFPEATFRHKFGRHEPQASWFHVGERMKFQICELAPDQQLPDSAQFYVEFLRFLTKKSGWFRFIDGNADFLPSDDVKSWVKPMYPKPEFKGEQVYYNAEVYPNSPSWFNYDTPLQMNPQTGIIANEVPLYVLDVDHTLGLDVVACLHVRMTCFANDNKYTMINTECDASNRIDQDVCAPMWFTLDEFVDVADQKHPFPITTYSPAFGGNVRGPDDDNDTPLKGQYVDILGEKLELQEILDDMTLLTAISEKNCKNDRKALLEDMEFRWKNGELIRKVFKLIIVISYNKTITLVSENMRPIEN